MTMRLLISILFPVIITLSGFSDTYIDFKLSESTPVDTLIQMERTVCFGTCPSYELTIHGSGKILFEGKEFVAHKGTAEGEISQEKLNQLVQLINEINFMHIPSDHECESRMTDHPSVFLTIEVGEERNSITHYKGCRGFEHEEELNRLEAAIDSVAGVNKWIDKK